MRALRVNENKRSFIRQNYKIISAAIGIAIVTFLVFFSALDGEFLIWDDDVLVTNNADIWSLDLDTVKWAFTNLGLTTWHPITFISFILDYSMWGLDPWGFHLTNNVIHALNALLVFLLIFLLVNHAVPEEDGNGLNKSAFISALITSLLFGLHPLRVESVAWIAARKDVLYSFFYLLSILAYYRYTLLKTNRGSLYIVSIIFFALSLMSKPVAVTLPAVLLVLDYYPLKRISLERGWEGVKPVIIEKIPFFILSALIAFVALMFHNSSADVEVMSGFSLLERIYLPIRGYMFYLYKMLLPYGLAPIHPIPDKLDDSILVLTLVITSFTAITFSGVFLLRHSRVYLSIWLYYIITLLPAISVLKIVGNNARFSYLACIGPALMAGLFADQIFRRSSSRAIKVFIIIIIFSFMAFYTSRTVTLVGIWKDTITLWSYQIALDPTKIPVAYMNRGLAYEKDGKIRLALADYSKALEINPEYAKAYNNRGVAYAGMHRYQEAMDDYNRSIELDPDYAQVYNNRCVLYGRLGEFERTIEDCTRAIEINPNLHDSYYNRGKAYFKLKRYESAIRDYSMAVRLYPKHMKAYNNRANAHSKLHQYEAAVKDYTKAIKISPQRGEYYFNRGNAYMKLEDYPSAIRDFTSAISINPDMSSVYNSRANSFSRLGKFDLALSDYKRAIDMDVTYAEAYFNRAMLYIKYGENENAYNDLKKASSLGLKEADSYLKEVRDIGRF